MDLTTAPIPYAQVIVDDLPRALLELPLPTTIDELLRYSDGDRAFVPPHWVRMRATRDARVGDKLLTAWRTLTPLVEGHHGENRRAVAEAYALLELDAADARVQAFAADAIERGLAPEATTVVFAMASQGRGARFDALFERADAPASAHLLRLSALRDHGGMPWSEAFARALTAALPNLSKEAAGWVLRFLSELTDARARRYLQGLAQDARWAPEVQRVLALAPEVPASDDGDELPTSIERLELGAIDPRQPRRQTRYLGRMAELDWPRARRLASSIATEDWRLDETVGALLNHPSHQAMADDFLARGLLSAPVEPPAGQPAARELLRKGGKVVSFDITSTEGVIDHDALAYRLLDAVFAAPSGLGTAADEGPDFLEEAEARALCLHAWLGDKHYRTELDVRRSVVDPYGLVGLFNVLMRQLGRPERGLLAAEDKGQCDVVVGPEKVLRELVDAGLLWIRSGFKL